MGSSFHILGAATEKARLPKLSFVLGTISTWGNSILGRSTKRVRFGYCLVTVLLFVNSTNVGKIVAFNLRPKLIL